MAVHQSAVKETKTAVKETKPEYTVLEECGTLASKNYIKGGELVTESIKLRYLQWSKGDARYDLRTWYETNEEEKPGKGVGMTGETLIALGELIRSMQEEPEEQQKAASKKTSRKKSA